jgi:D-threonate/D-erythronate kinase
MPARLLILADDFTGALDAGVRLALAGVGTRVAARREGDSPSPAYGEPVLVIDTETRHVGPEEAARQVRDCVRLAAREGTVFFYKKTDSTLRGNIGAELSALLAETGADCLFFVPALPAAGRTTVKGVAFVDGVPLHRTSFAADPLDPVTESAVAAIVARQSAVAVEVVPRGSDPPHCNGASRRILVFDAETDADLQEIGRRIKRTALPRATAGCSGFASILPQLLDLPLSTVPSARLAAPMLAVCGSLHEASRAQIRYAEERGIPSYVVDARSDAAPGLGRMVAQALASRGAAIVKSASVVESGEARSGRAIAAALGAVAAEAMAVVRASTLVLFGGDTAFGVTEALGVRAFQPVCEISQGVVVSRAEHGGRELHLVTKAGGFGAPDLLSRIRETLGKEI